MGFLNLIIKMGLDAAGVDVGLKRAESSVKKFSNNVNSAVKAQIAGAISIGAMTMAAKKAVEFGSHVNDISTRFGITTDRVQELDFAMKQTSGTIEDATSAMTHLARSRNEALKAPGGDLEKEFKRLGVTVEQLKTARLDSIFDTIGNSIEKARDPQEQFAAGFATMGRGAQPVIGMMREGFAGFADDARRLGIIVQEETITAMDDLGDKLDMIAAKLNGSVMTALAKILGVVGDLIGGLEQLGRLFGALSVGQDITKNGTGGTNKSRIDQALDVVAQMENTSSTAPKKAQARRDLSGLLGDFSPVQTNSPGYQKSNLNNLQQIGAYSAVDPLVRSVTEQTTLQRQTVENTKRVANATEKLVSKDQMFTSTFF